MDSLTLAISQKEESDSAAERRWENEGGNPGQVQQLPCDGRKGGARTGLDQGALKAFRYTCGAQIPPKCKGYDQSPNRMRGAEGC
jgi:hypothetical protein